MNYKTIEIENRNPSYAAFKSQHRQDIHFVQNSGLILIINTHQGEIESKISVDYPMNIVVSSSLNKVYVSATNGVYEIDGSTNEYNQLYKKPEIASIGLGIQDCPSSLRDHLFAVDPTTNKVYTSKYEDESISGT